MFYTYAKSKLCVMFIKKISYLIRKMVNEQPFVWGDYQSKYFMSRMKARCRRFETAEYFFCEERVPSEYRTIYAFCRKQEKRPFP